MHYLVDAVLVAVTTLFLSLPCTFCQTIFEFGKVFCVFFSATPDKIAASEANAQLLSPQSLQSEPLKLVIRLLACWLSFWGWSALGRFTAVLFSYDIMIDLTGLQRLFSDLEMFFHHPLTLCFWVVWSLLWSSSLRFCHINDSPQKLDLPDTGVVFTTISWNHCTTHRWSPFN